MIAYSFHFGKIRVTKIAYNFDEGAASEKFWWCDNFDVNKVP